MLEIRNNNELIATYNGETDEVIEYTILNNDNKISLFNKFVTNVKYILTIK